MNRSAAIISILAALAVGVVLGYALGQSTKDTPAKQREAAEDAVQVFRRAARRDGDGERQACLREKLGSERYAALVLNPNAATAEDQFKILPCFQK